MLPIPYSPPAPPSEHLIQELRPDHLRVCFAGKRTAHENLNGDAVRIIESCYRLNRNKLIIERDRRSTLSDTDLFVVMNRLLSHNMRGMKIAYVDPTPPPKSAVELTITEAAKTGRDIRSFPDLRTAIAWFSDPGV